MKTTNVKNRWPPTDDKDLLLRLRHGDHAAFESVYHIYKDRLIHNLLRVLKSRDLVEELLQDLFLKIWERRAQIDPEKPFKAYLFTVAGNMAKNLLRKASYDRQLYTLLLPDNEKGYTHIEEQLVKKDNQALLNQLLAKLPPQRRKVYMLCKLEGRSYKEVSESLGITEGTVNDHIRKANLFFKEMQAHPNFVILVLIQALLHGIN